MYFADFACISAVGPCAATTMAAVSANASGYRDADYLCGNRKFATMALLDDVLFDTVFFNTSYTGSISEKMIRCGVLLYFALQDLLQRFKPENPAPLLWVDDEPDIRQTLPTEYLVDILQQNDAPVSATDMLRANTGRAGGIQALQRASQLLHEQGHDYVVIAAADCPLENPWLDWLDEHSRLKNSEAKDAFAPGESCALMVVARTPELARINGDKNKSVSQFSLPASASSPSHWYNYDSHKGDALADAISQVLELSENNQPFDALITSLNGELFWMKEHRVALARNSQWLKDSELHHAFQSVGDLGPVSGIFLLAQAAMMIEDGQYSNTLVYAMSDKNWRSAAKVSRGQ